MNALPIVLFWLLICCAIISRPPFALYLFFATMPFGACAAIPTNLTGGLTFVATPIVALIIIGKTFLTRGGPSSFLTLALLPDRLLCLFAFWIVASVATLFMPHLFAGDILVVPVRGVLSTPVPLHPTTQNLSQWVYMTISVFTVFAMARLLQNPAMRQHALQSICLGAAMLIATGLLDFASQYLPLAAVLAPFRTASYALATEVEVLGSKRVVGLMPEASAFGNYCLGFLCALHFYRRAILSQTFRDRICPILLVLLVVLCWQSKSSAAYVGLAVFAAIAALEWLLRAHTQGQGAHVYRQGLMGELSVLVTILVAITLALLFKPGLLDPILALIDRMSAEDILPVVRGTRNVAGDRAFQPVRQPWLRDWPGEHPLFQQHRRGVERNGNTGRSSVLRLRGAIVLSIPAIRDRGIRNHHVGIPVFLCADDRRVVDDR